MKILEKGIQFGKYSVLVELNDGNGMRLQFSQPTADAAVLLEAQNIVNQQLSESTFNSIETEQFDILNYVGLLKEFIVKIKATPSITLSQYNTYLGTKQWYEAVIIRFFVFVLASKLSEKKKITLIGMTETQILTALRNWIVATDLKTIGKIIGDDTSNN